MHQAGGYSALQNEVAIDQAHSQDPAAPREVISRQLSSVLSRPAIHPPQTSMTCASEVPVRRSAFAPEASGCFRPLADDHPQGPARQRCANCRRWDQAALRTLADVRTNTTAFDPFRTIGDASIF